jgi:hypothetical protein
VTQLSICPIGASDEGRTCGSGAEAHSKRRPRRQLSNKVCWGQNRKNSNRANVFRCSPNYGLSAVLPCPLPGGQPYFSNANRHDAHAAKIISFLQNYECGISD